MSDQQAFQIEPTRAAVSAFADTFAGWCAARGVPERIVGAFLVALDELLVNLVEHGGCPGPASIDVRLDRAAACLSVRVVDRGEAFDPLLEAPNPDTTSALENRPVGGLGLLLVRRLMDRVEYRRADGSNQLTIAKHLNQDPRNDRHA